MVSWQLAQMDTGYTLQISSRPSLWKGLAMHDHNIVCSIMPVATYKCIKFSLISSVQFYVIPAQTCTHTLRHMGNFSISDLSTGIPLRISAGEGAIPINLETPYQSPKTIGKLALQDLRILIWWQINPEWCRGKDKLILVTGYPPQNFVFSYTSTSSRLTMNEGWSLRVNNKYDVLPLMCLLCIYCQVCLRQTTK